MKTSSKNAKTCLKIDDKWKNKLTFFPINVSISVKLLIELYTYYWRCPKKSYLSIHSNGFVEGEKSIEAVVPPDGCNYGNYGDYYKIVVLFATGYQVIG